MAGNRDVIVILQDSQDVTDSEFSHMKSFTQTLIAESTPETKIAMLACHVDYSVISPLQGSKDKLSESLERYSKQSSKSSTLLNITLKKCSEIFTKSKTRGEQVLIILANGITEEASDGINSLIKSGVTVVVCGIGSAKIEDLEKFASPNKCSMLQNLEVDAWLRGEEKTDHPKSLQLIIISQYMKIAFGDDLTLKVMLKNNGYEPLEAFELHFTPAIIQYKKYFKEKFVCISESIAVGDSIEIDITFNCTGETFFYIHEEIPFTAKEMQSGMKIFTAPNSIRLSSEWFSGKFVNYSSPNPVIAPKVNILFYGVIGAGKSSFMNSIFTSLLSEYCDVANVGGGANHCTRNLRCFPLGKNVDQLGDCNIQFWDTWGVESQNYNAHFLSDLLNGKIPNGFSMIQERSRQTTPLSNDEMNEIERRIHGVFLFVPIGILEDKGMVKTIHDILQIIKEKEVFVTLIVTRADTVKEPHLLQSEITQEFKLLSCQVAMVSNYTKSREKEFLIDKMTLYVISLMIDDCGAYIRNHLARFANRFESIPSPLPTPPVVYPLSPPSHEHSFADMSKSFADLHVSTTGPSPLVHPYYQSPQSSISGPQGANQYSQNYNSPTPISPYQQANNNNNDNNSFNPLSSYTSPAQLSNCISGPSVPNQYSQNFNPISPQNSYQQEINPIHQNFPSYLSPTTQSNSFNGYPSFSNSGSFNHSSQSNSFNQRNSFTFNHNVCAMPLQTYAVSSPQNHTNNYNNFTNNQNNNINYSNKSQNNANNYNNLNNNNGNQNQQYQNQNQNNFSNQNSF